jgi:hypothetical protein
LKDAEKSISSYNLRRSGIIQNSFAKIIEDLHIKVQDRSNMDSEISEESELDSVDEIDSNESD